DRRRNVAGQGAEGDGEALQAVGPVDHNGLLFPPGRIARNVLAAVVESLAIHFDGYVARVVGLEPQEIGGFRLAAPWRFVRPEPYLGGAGVADVRRVLPGVYLDPVNRGCFGLPTGEMFDN